MLPQKRKWLSLLTEKTYHLVSVVYLGAKTLATTLETEGGIKYEIYRNNITDLYIFILRCRRCVHGLYG